MTNQETSKPQEIDEQLASAITTRNRPSRSSAISATLTFGWRAMLKIKHVPAQLVDVTAFPILMTLLMTFVFGGALAGSSREYAQQLIPGIMILSITMISMYAAIGLSTDITKGIFDRFRSLPFWRPAVLVGALMGDVVRYVVAAAVVIALGLLLGFRPEAGIGGVLLSLGVVLVFAFSLSWVWTTIGLLMKDPEAVAMATGMTSFPLTFISNVFVDPATMPEFLQKFVNINPVSITTTAVRGLMSGSATASQIWQMFLASAILIVIFAPLTMYLYNNKNAK